jgi:hypothetical protein
MVVVMMIPVMMMVVAVIPSVMMVMVMVMVMPRQLRGLVLPGLRFRAVGIRRPSGLQ